MTCDKCGKTFGYYKGYAFEMEDWFCEECGRNET